MQLLLFLEPARDEDIQVGGLGMSPGPLPDSLVIAVLAELLGSFVMKGGVAGDFDLPGIGIRPGKVMGKVVLAELVVVGKQPLDALLFLGGSLLDKDLRPGHRLDKLAMFGPASLCLIDFALGCHSTLLFVELLSDVQVLVAVDDLQEFWSDL